MKRKEFLEKHNFTDADWRNLVRFERIRLSGIYNMFEILVQMVNYNTNGGKRLAEWIQQDNNYSEFIDILNSKDDEEV